MQRRKRLAAAIPMSMLAIGSVFVSANPSAAADETRSTPSKEIPLDQLVADDAARSRAIDRLATVKPYARPPVLDEDSALLVATKDIPEFGGLWLDDTPNGPVVTLALTTPRTRAAALTTDVARAFGAAGRPALDIPSARALTDGTDGLRLPLAAEHSIAPDI